MEIDVIFVSRSRMRFRSASCFARMATIPLESARSTTITIQNKSALTDWTIRITWDWTFNPCGVDHLKEESAGHEFHSASAQTLGSTITFYPSPAKEEEITDAIGAKAVIQQLEQHRKDPFFIAYGLYRPHVPWIVPSQYFDRYSLDQIQALPFDPEELRIAPPPAYWTQPPNFGMSDLQQRQAIRSYYAATTFMDAQIGKVLNALESLALADNTIVVLLGGSWLGPWASCSMDETDPL